jgi:hypothetical protein
MVSSYAQSLRRISHGSNLIDKEAEEKPDATSDCERKIFQEKAFYPGAFGSWIADFARHRWKYRFTAACL